MLLVKVQKILDFTICHFKLFSEYIFDKSYKKLRFEKNENLFSKIYSTFFV